MVNEQLIDEVAAKVGEIGVSEPGVVSLRAIWPDVHFTYCSDDDVSAAAKPLRSFDDYNLYLVAGAGGCVSFTGSLEAATGIVIAEVEEDWEA